MTIYYITDLESRTILTDEWGRELWCKSRKAAEGIARHHQAHTGHATGYVRAENPANDNLARQTIPWSL